MVGGVGLFDLLEDSFKYYNFSYWPVLPFEVEGKIRFKKSSYYRISALFYPNVLISCFI